MTWIPLLLISVILNSRRSERFFVSPLGSKKWSATVLCFSFYYALGLVNSLIYHFTVLCSVTWCLNGSVAGGDLALIQTYLLLNAPSYTWPLNGSEDDAYVGCDLPYLDQQFMKVRTHLLLSESLSCLPSEVLSYLSS